MEKKTVQSNKRKSNIELLRIICTLMVITLHIQNPALLGGVKYARESGSFFNEAIMSWLFCMSIIAVDVFILISGYFMINSSKRKLGKAVNLLFVCSAYSVVKTLVNLIAAGKEITFTAIASGIFPKSYYVYIYCALYLLSPYINRAVEGIDKKSYRRLICVSGILFSLYPTVMDCIQQQRGISSTDISFIAADGNGRGFTFVNFVLLYLIGGYIRKHGKTHGSKSEKYKSLFTSLGISVLSCAVSFVFPKLWGTNGIIAYNSVLVIIQAAAFFNFFIQLDLRYNAVINFLAKASFGVFLLHMAVIRVVSAHFDIHMYFQKGTVSALLCYLALLFSSYIVSMLFDSLARFVMTPVSKLWSQTKLFSYDTGFTLTKKGNS